jgi:hypothetical protein
VIPVFNQYDIRSQLSIVALVGCPIDPYNNLGEILIMRFAEYFTCCPKQDFSDGNAQLRNGDWAPAYQGSWECWAKEAWFEEKKNRQIAWHRLKECYLHRQEELDLSHLGLRCLPILPRQVKILNASHNKLTGLPYPYPTKLIQVDLSNNDIEQVPSDLLYEAEELILTGNPLNKKFRKTLHYPTMTHVKFEENPPKPPHHTEQCVVMNISWPSEATVKLSTKK